MMLLILFQTDSYFFSNFSFLFTKCMYWVFSTLLRYPLICQSLMSNSLILLINFISHEVFIHPFFYFVFFFVVKQFIEYQYLLISTLLKLIAFLEKWKQFFSLSPSVIFRNSLFVFFIMLSHLSYITRDKVIFDRIKK